MKSEELVAKSYKLWSDVLKNEKIDKEADFFDQGGTSLSLIELLSETRKQFSVDLKVTDFEQGLSLGLYEKLVSKAISQQPQTAV